MEELLQRYIKGETSEEEKQLITKWLDETPENMREYMALRKLYDISLWNTTNHKQIESERKQKSLRRFTLEFAKVAAVLLIGFLAAWQVFYKQTRTLEEVSMQTIHVPAGQRAELTLADGTKVWLNSRSTLKFPNQFQANAREVELDGEGYFTVQHNQTSPFTVQTEKYAIRVLGTEFNVKAYHNSDLFETALLKGSVEIAEANHISHALRLKPNQLASTNNGQLTTQTISDYNYFKWKEGLFCFENETVASLIEKMQLYYDVNIEVRKDSLFQYHYSGKFRIKDGIEHVLKVLQLKHKFTYTKDEKRNLIVIE